MKNSFLLYYDLEDSFELLTNEEAGELIKAVFKYEIKGEETEFPDRMLKMTFKRIIENLDRNKEKYEEKCEKSRKAINSRWKKEKSKDMKPNTDVYERIPTDTDNDNVNDNVNDNDNDNVNVYVNDNEVKNEKGLPSEENIHTQKIILGKFKNVFLSKEEYEELKLFYHADWERRVESLSAYMKSSGKSYDSHYAKLCEWKIYDGGDQTVKKKTSKKESDASYDIDAYLKQIRGLRYVKADERDNE